MRFSLKATIWIGCIFALACVVVAAKGFTALPEISDPAVLADAKGFAWFWMFLAGLCAGLAALAAWMLRGVREEE